ncbi:PKD domain-containing protein [Thiocystis violacea]|uniref:PKD domain-containing protein n=1 Tax=Thiocystis violacea TaxID=13725 RepID=UPI001F5B7E7A|nr:PKD domain-containing protein [Thiocystis violacea]MBK1721584.1 hypothetical protein [Thiocystis violacea]
MMRPLQSYSPLKGCDLSSILGSAFKAAVLFGLTAMANGAAGAVTQVVDLQWDAVDDVRVDHYELRYGPTSGQYDNTTTTTLTEASVELTASGTTYFAVRACDASAANCSAFSNEISVTPSAGEGQETESPLVVDFSASTLSGSAPLTVTFSDLSSAQSSSGASSDWDAPQVAASAESSASLVTTRAWDFGDGGQSNAGKAVHTYSVPGTYTVSLTVNGPNGTASETKVAYISVLATAASSASSGGTSATASTTSETAVIQALPIEIGDMQINHNWKRIDFQQAFENPIVVAKGLSSIGADPAVIRIRDVDSTGFWVRVQEWDYLNGWHATELASYIAMERGQYELPNGILVEAGSLTTDATAAFQFQELGAGFSKAPVVFASINSVNEEDAVTSRIRQTSANGFFVKMQEQELNSQTHAAERIDYIAWQASSVEVDGMRFDVGFAPSGINQDRSTLAYDNAFGDAPVFLADMQTTNGSDPCSLRLKDMTTGSVKMWVQEEQSKDSELGHLSETVGYFVAELAD